MSESESTEDPWQSVPGQGAAAAPQQQGAQFGYGHPQPGQPAPGYYPQPGMPAAPPYYYQPFPTRKTNGLAVASLVCGICGFIYLAPAILGVIFGCISLRQIKRDGTDGRGMAIGGIVTGSAWLALVATAVIAVIAAAN